MEHNDDRAVAPAGAEEQEILAQSRKLKKRLLIILACVATAVLLGVGIWLLVDALTREETPSFQFYPATDENIFENPTYMEKDREIYFTDSDGVEERVDEAFILASNNAEIKLMYDYVHAIIDGNEAYYNLLFNKTYYDRAEPKTAFTQQMLYDIALSVYSYDVDKNGERLVTYRLEYTIYRNNGTYRNDCEPGKESPELLTLRIAKDGVVSIERRLLYREATK